MFDAIVGTVRRCIREEADFRALLSSLPESDRRAVYQRRDDERREIRRQREHAEMVEAAKPHNLWSFLGLGSK